MGKKKPERDPRILKKFRKEMDAIRAVSPTYGPMDFTTGGSSQNHDVSKRKDNSGRGALDLSYKANDIKDIKDRVNVAKAIKGEGLRVGVDSKHLHMDDRNSPVREFKEDNSDTANAVINALREKAQNVEQVGRGVALSQSMEGSSIVNKAISENKELNSIEKKHLQEEMSNPEQIVEKISSNQEKKQVGGKPSVKDNFMEALTFFLPNIVGMGIGALISGTEGAVAGEIKGGQLGTSLREYGLKRRELELKERPSVHDIEKLDIQKKNLELRKQ